MPGYRPRAAGGDRGFAPGRRRTRASRPHRRTPLPRRGSPRRPLASSRGAVRSGEVNPASTAPSTLLISHPIGPCRHCRYDGITSSRGCADSSTAMHHRRKNTPAPCEHSTRGDRADSLRTRCPRRCKHAAARERACASGLVGRRSHSWSHSSTFRVVRHVPTSTGSPGRGPCRPSVNSAAHAWKACWGQPLKSSNLLSSARVTRDNVRSACPPPVPLPRARLSFRPNPSPLTGADQHKHRALYDRDGALPGRTRQGTQSPTQGARRLLLRGDAAALAALWSWLRDQRRPAGWTEVPGGGQGGWAWWLVS